MSSLRSVALVALLPLALLAGCGSASEPSTPKAKPGSVSCTYADARAAVKKVAKPPADTDPAAPTSVVISTNAGDIPVTLDTAKAPCAVNSFLSLAKQGYFDDTPCHRVSTQGYYILQCGDPGGDGFGGPGYSFADELVPNDPRLQPCQGSGQTLQCTYNTGTVAMANSGADTNGSQFFLVYGPSLFPPNYVILGQMDAGGLKTVKAIAAKGTADGAPDGAPKETVTITSVK